MASGRTRVMPGPTRWTRSGATTRRSSRIELRRPPLPPSKGRCWPLSKTSSRRAGESGSASTWRRPVSDFSRQALYQAMLSLANDTFSVLRQRLAGLPTATREEARKVLELEGEVRNRFRLLRDRKIAAIHLRCHGDYHLGQVLHTGKDFIIIDFEGESARPLGVRRLKCSPLRDVAGMLRSFHYAAYAALLGQVPGTRPEDFPTLEPWARFWYRAVSAAFLKGYLPAAASASLLPQAPAELGILLDAYLLDKAIYEIGYELNNRPEWTQIPLKGLLELFETER